MGRGARGKGAGAQGGEGGKKGWRSEAKLEGEGG